MCDRLARPREVRLVAVLRLSELTGAPADASLPALRLAFRTYLVARMRAVLAEDAMALAEDNTDSVAQRSA